jgi:Fic family protein
VNRKQTGEFVTVSSVGGEVCQAFVPRPLPPEPPLVLDGHLQELYERALVALGRLDSITTLLPDPALFLYMYVRKEAVLSSQIEGTQSSLSDLLLFEIEGAPGVPLADVQEVSNYVAAMDHGLERLRGGFPLSLRLIREIHGRLLSAGRGSDRDPGEFRRSQNWIGGTRPGNAVFVPPPADRVLECLGALEKFMHNDPVKTPALVKAAMVHVQFETVHPFLDGNGRLGRLLITFLLCSEGLLAQPVLYLSLYLKSRRQEYYDLLQCVRTPGDWEAWLEFFLTGVRETADQAVQAAKAITALFAADRNRIQGLGRPAGSCLRVHHALQQSPVASVAVVAKLTQLTVPTVTASMRQLAGLGVTHEVTGRRWGRIFTYAEYLRLLNEGTEPLR